MDADGTTVRSGHVIVCGLHDLGMRVVEQLRIAGEDVVVADDQPDTRLLNICDDLGAQFLAGNGRRSAVLSSAGIAAAAALVCADESDLVNLEIALLARRMRPDIRVVVQLGNQAVASAVARVTGTASVLDVATIAAPSLAEACLDGRSRAVEIGGEPFLLSELDVEHDGTLRRLYGDLAPIAVVPADGGPMHVCPGRDLPVAVGDRVVVLSPAADLLDRGLVTDEVGLSPTRGGPVPGRGCAASSVASSRPRRASCGGPCARCSASPWSRS